MTMRQLPSLWRRSTATHGGSQGDIVIDQKRHASRSTHDAKGLRLGQTKRHIGVLVVVLHHPRATGNPCAARSASAAAEEAPLVIAYSPRIGHMKSCPLIEPRLPSIQYPRNRPNSAAQRSAHRH
jgi:hypothetical protein